MTPDEHLGIVPRKERKFPPLPPIPPQAAAMNEATEPMVAEIKSRDDGSVDRERDAPFRGLNDEELLRSFSLDRIMADAELLQSFDTDIIMAEADAAIGRLEAESGRALGDTKHESATDSAQESLNSIPRERKMPDQQRVIQRGLPRRPKPLPKPEISASPERREPVGRAWRAAKPSETKGGDGK